jgi:hypothetical protein
VRIIRAKHVQNATFSQNYITVYPNQNHTFVQFFDTTENDPKGSSVVSISSPLKNKVMTTGKIIWSIAAGVAAGAILGVLFAPNKGVDTRRKIVQKKDDAVDSINEMLENVTGKLEDVKKQASRMMANGMAKV